MSVTWLSVGAFGDKMARFWITGTQLGIIKAGLTGEGKAVGNALDIIIDVIDEQFIGNFETDKDKERFERRIKKVK